MNAQQKIIARLTEGSARLSELAVLLDCRARTIPPIISRLRTKQFRIMSESTSMPRDPRYTLVGGPGSLAPDSFVCPGCSSTIRLGHVEDHNPRCQFGPAVLQSLGHPGRPRRTWRES